MGKSKKTSQANFDSDSVDSWMTGISTRNLGCLFFLIFCLEIEIGLLRDLCNAEDRQVLAWKIASSLELGGLNEDEEDCFVSFSRDKHEILELLVVFW